VGGGGGGKAEVSGRRLPSLRRAQGRPGFGKIGERPARRFLFLGTPSLNGPPVLSLLRHAQGLEVIQEPGRRTQATLANPDDLPSFLS
jgi:hypothetical protein